MDLSSLQATLGVRDERPSPEPLPADFQFAGPSLADQILARHRNSTQPDSQQLCVILAAVVEVITAEGLQPTPTALFAAVMSSLQRPETTSNPDVTTAMCNLLSTIMGHVPTSILRSRCAQSGQVLVAVLENCEGHAHAAAVSKAALPCLSQFIAAMGPSDWPALSRGFNIVLLACLENQPKLRKKAQFGLVDIFASLQSVPAALLPASEAVLKLSQRVLPGPEAAAQAAAAAPSKKRQQAEEVIAKTVSDALHLMGTLKQIIFLLSGSTAQAICELLLHLYPLRQPLLTRHTTDTLAALCASSASHLNPRALSELLNAVLLSEATWDKKDVDSAIGMTRLLEEGLMKLAAADPAAAAAVLPRIVHALLPQLASHQDGVRRGTAYALRNIINAGLQESEVAAAVTAGGKTGRKLSSVQRVVIAVESSLGPQYRDAWEGSLTIAGELLEKLGRRGAPLSQGLVLRIGQLCAGADDVAAEDDKERVAEEAKLTLAAQTALGIALRALGPDVVLSVLPLHLEEGLEGSEEARTWLLPLLRVHVRGARVGYWKSTLLPLARAMGARAAAAGRDAAREREAQVCSTLEVQLWSTFPSFCTWAEDAGEVFPALSKAIAPAFEKRPDLRTPICNALRRLATQTRQALRSHDEVVGHADPTLTSDEAPPITSDHHPDSSSFEKEQEDALDQIPSTYTLETAHSVLQALREEARTWLPLLLNAFVGSPSNQRGHIGAAVAAYACICDPGSIAQLFRAAITKLMKVTEQARSGELGRDAVLEGGDSDTERRCTFMEAALLLAGGLDVNGVQVLWKAAVPGTLEKDPAVQKKAYKILSYLCESRPDFSQPHFQEVLRVLLQGTTSTMSASKRYRLGCLKAAILELVREDGADVDLSTLPGVAAVVVSTAHHDDGREGATRAARARHVITPMVTEIILCVKEANKRARTAAFDLLIEVATAMHEAEPPILQINDFEIRDDDDDSDEDGMAAAATTTTSSGADGGGGLRSLVNIVLGGLVGATPHMISASVIALARLLFEFAPVLAGLVPALLPSVLLLLRSKAREVIKSVLGFVKVVVMRLPTPELLHFTPAICQGILLWAEDSKNKFRLKVRIILERLARRCGFEALETAVPESHRALLTHIRKQQGRKERKRGAGSEMDWQQVGIDGDGDDDDDDDGRSRKSKAHTARTGRTAARSAWNSEVFSDEDEEDGRSEAVGSMQTSSGRRGLAGGAKSARSAASHHAKTTSRRLPSSEDPLDLLDVGTARKMVRGGTSSKNGGTASRGGKKGQEGDDEDFQMGKDGRMVIREEVPIIGKRKRGDAERAGFDSDDSDFEDLKGYTGLELALKGSKSVAQAPTIAASLGGKSLGARSQGARSAGGRSRASTGGGGGGGQQARRGGQHTGDRFKSKKGATGGDVKGGSKVEPYAYWPLDRKMLNRRAQKTRVAKSGLDRVVSAAKGGAGVKGAKAKRARHSADR